MDKKLLVVVFFIILSTQEIGAVTRICKSRSREFAGRCIRLNQRNCNIVCQYEGFQYGVCTKQARCYCAKPCGSTNTKTPPAVETPPENGPPDQDGGQFLIEETQS
ncbi:hypothetical protein ACP275_10G132300 [Erythranthe tilingii]